MAKDVEEFLPEEDEGSQGEAEAFADEEADRALEEARARGGGMEIFPTEEEDPEFHQQLDEAFEHYLSMKRREEAGEDLTEEWAEIHRRAEENYQAMLRGEI